MDQQLQSRLNSIVAAIIAQLEQSLAVLVQAAQDAHFAATHSESVAESKYDTFGLESSYLAQGQQKRVDEVNQALYYFNNIDLTQSSPSEFVATLCYVELTALESNHQNSATNPTQRAFFLADFGGGLTFEIDGKMITVITPQSPMGQLLINKTLDDEVDLAFKGQEQPFELGKISAMVSKKLTLER